MLFNRGFEFPSYVSTAKQPIAPQSLHRYIKLELQRNILMYFFYFVNMAETINQLFEYRVSNSLG